MTKKDRERSYRVFGLEKLLSKEGLRDEGGTYCWFPALMRFMKALDVDVMYLPAGKKPGVVWFTSSDSGEDEAFDAYAGFRVKGTKNGTATGDTFERMAKTYLKGLSGDTVAVNRAGTTAAGPDGCVRTTFCVDEYAIPEFSSPEELFFRMSVAGIGKATA